MKTGKIIIICIIIIVFTVGCTTNKNKLDEEKVNLEVQVAKLNEQVDNDKLEKNKLEENIKTLTQETIPRLENKIIENEKIYEESMIKLIEENIGFDYQRLLFKKDINMVLSYLSSIGYIPVYEGEIYSYTQKHIELINNWFVEFSDERAKEIPAELMKWLYPIVIPIKITKTEVGFKSQYENTYYYNVVHYVTYGSEGHYSESKTIRGIGGVEDGFGEVYIIEIHQENSEWKIGYTGFGG